MQQAPPAILLAALRRFRGPAVFRGLRPSSSPGAPCWPSGLTRRSSRPAYGGRLTLAVRLTKKQRPLTRPQGVLRLQRRPSASVRINSRVQSLSRHIKELCDFFDRITLIIQMLERGILIPSWHLIEHCPIESFLNTTGEKHMSPFHRRLVGSTNKECFRTVFIIRRFR